MIAECVITIENPLSFKDVIDELHNWKVRIPFLEGRQSRPYPFFDEFLCSLELNHRHLRRTPTDKRECCPPCLDSRTVQNHFISCVGNNARCLQSSLSLPHRPL